MMNLAETAPVPSAELPLAELKTHLRLPAGFADDGSMDAKLEGCLRAALAAIEARTGKALFERGFLLQVDGWSRSDGQDLPLAPVSGVDDVTITWVDDSQTVLDIAGLRVVPDAHRPALEPRTGVFPGMARGGTIAVSLTAGYGATWPDLPGDLREAVLILAAEYFDAPGSGAGGPVIPTSVAVLLERYRKISLRGIGV